MFPAPDAGSPPISPAALLLPSFLPLQRRHAARGRSQISLSVRGHQRGNEDFDDVLLLKINQQKYGLLMGCWWDQAQKIAMLWSLLQ